MTEYQRTVLILLLAWWPGVADVARGQQVVLSAVEPSGVHISGFVGDRMDRNRLGILIHKDEDALLEPFRRRGTGKQAWLGEHVGKWLSAASIAYAQSGDRALREKLDRVAHSLTETQMEDGYLGTYVESDRWTSWDVWVHKYNLLGLLDYYDATGDENALAACRRIGDLLIATFGPDKRDIIRSGEHSGMAATSVLEPVVRLFETTREQKYLYFAEYLVASIERPEGPRIVSTLLDRRNVCEVATAKAYEMISNILGLLRMYRIEGDERYRQAAIIACDDILANRLYITGGCSFGEYFRAEGILPNAGHVAETCVTMSLLPLYRELLLLTGDAKYGDAAEQLIFNHLLACQSADGEAICYYTPLWGHKSPMDFLGCCISSGPRALAMVPSLYYLRAPGRVVVNLLGESRVDTRLPDGTRVQVDQTTTYPFSGKVTIEASASGGTGCVLSVRIPTCAHPRSEVRIEGQSTPLTAKPGSLLNLTLRERAIRIELDLELTWQIVPGTGQNYGLFALRYGPMIYAFDYDANRSIPGVFDSVFDSSIDALAPTMTTTGLSHVAHVNGHVRPKDGASAARRVALLPFAEAGEKDHFSVWLRDRAIDPKKRFSLFTQVTERCSRKGTRLGSIADNSADTWTSTDDGKRRELDWFEVNAGWHMQYNVIVFRHGRSTANGGWFDTSQSKPKIWFKTWHDYEEIGELADYPDTTADQSGPLADGQAFRFVIPKDKRRKDFRVRISGAPAHGSDPSQNFSTCSEIQVFYDPDL